MVEVQTEIIAPVLSNHLSALAKASQTKATAAFALCATPVCECVKVSLLLKGGRAAARWIEVLLPLLRQKRKEDLGGW